MSRAQADEPDNGPRDIELGAGLDELERLRSEIGPGAGYTVNVYKRSADGTRFDRCRRFPLDQFDLDRLPVIFGGGEFTLGVNDDKGKRIETYRVSFDPKLYPAPQQDAAPPVSPPPQPSTDGGAASVIQELKQLVVKEQERSQRLLETVVNGLMARPSSGSSLKDRLEELKLLQEMQKGTNTPVNEIAEAIRQGIQLGQGRGDAAGESDEGEGMTKILDFLGKVAERAGKVEAKPAPSNRQPAVAAQPASIPDQLRPYAWLRKYAGTLIGWARVEFDPARVAQVIYAMVPDEQAQVLEEIARMEPAQRHQILVQLDSGLQPYRGYLDQVAREIALIFDDDDNADAGGAADADQVSTQPA